MTKKRLQALTPAALDAREHVDEAEGGGVAGRPQFREVAGAPGRFTLHAQAISASHRLRGQGRGGAS